ncbi:MAG: urea ABC transporter permease subunit UrtB [Alphaproteobacteria bacterium]|nr:urea ABC transporter permease subunit UrtB [Alphaproteobacteria bacterium]
MAVTIFADVQHNRVVLFSILFAMLALLAFSNPVFAQQDDIAVNAALSDLNARSFKGKTAAVEALGLLGDARAVPTLEALSEGRLYVRKTDKSVVIAERAGKAYLLIDPVTGAAMGEATSREIKKIIANNKLRGLIRGVLGQLALSSSDPELRRAAVENVISSPTNGSLALLKTARDREIEDDIRARLETGIATLELGSDDPGLRRAAVDRLADGNDPVIKSLLERRLLKNTDGSFVEPDAGIRAEVQEAVNNVNDRLALFGLAEDLIFGISLGSVLLLAAIGLAVTFGVMGVINMAHGEMIMLGAYTTFFVQEIFRATMPAEAFGFYLLASIPAAFFVAAAFGILIERGCIRFLYGRPLETLLATWGISLILQQMVRSLFGANNREVANPDWISGAISIGGGVSVTVSRVYIVVFCLVVVAALAAFIRYSRFGLQMRAVTQNRGMASAMGIRTGQVDSLTFALGSGIAGVAGVALSQISNVSPNLGQNFIVDSFLVVVFGGVGSLWGTIVGAFGLGIVNKFLEPVAGAILGKVVVLVIIILFIQKRPRGLFALKGRAAEG